MYISKECKNFYYLAPTVIIFFHKATNKKYIPIGLEVLFDHGAGNTTEASDKVRYICL